MKFTFSHSVSLHMAAWFPAQQTGVTTEPRDKFVAMWAVACHPKLTLTRQHHQHFCNTFRSRPSCM